MTGKVKRQHYVPQFYLREFAEDGQLVWVFDKSEEKAFKANIRDVASEWYFYDFPATSLAEGVDPQLVEKELAKIEAQFSDALETVLSEVQESGRIDPQHKSLMSQFMALQELRTPAARNSWIEMEETVMQRVLELQIQHKMPELSDHDYTVRVNPEVAAMRQAMFMFSPKMLLSICRILQNHIWLVGINETSQPFYTSDCPLVRRPHKEKKFWSTSGLGSEGIEIAFPLTPKYILVLFDRRFFGDIACRDCGTIPINSDTVTYYNSLQVFQSSRQLYSPSDTFALAQEICHEHPEVRDPDRSQLEIQGG